MFAQSIPTAIETENRPPTTPRMREVVISDTYIGPTPNKQNVTSKRLKLLALQHLAGLYD